MTCELVSNLRTFVVEELLYAEDISELGADDELLGSGLLDSISSAQLMLYVETQFNVKLRAADLTYENFNTLGALAALVLKRQ